MTITVTEVSRMPGGRKKENFERARLELVADAPWIARLAAQADRLGMSLSAYVRMACTRQVEADEANAPPAPPKKNGGRAKP